MLGCYRSNLSDDFLVAVASAAAEGKGLGELDSGGAPADDDDDVRAAAGGGGRGDVLKSIG